VPALPVSPTLSSSLSPADTVARAEQDPLETARSYYEAISEMRIGDAARMRGLSQSAAYNLESNRAAFETYRADGFELTERDADGIVVEA
jgi:hypothetical protein